MAKAAAVTTSKIAPILRHGFNANGRTPKAVYRIPQDDVDWMRKFGEKNGCSVNEVVRQAVAKYRRDRERPR